MSDPAVRVDEEGFVVIEDPEIEAIVNEVYQAQEEAFRLGLVPRGGLRLRFRAGKGEPIVNLLCEPGADCGPLRIEGCIPNPMRSR